jgi:hypothetical protein
MLAVPHKNTAPPHRIAHAIASGIIANFIVASPYMFGCDALIPMFVLYGCPYLENRVSQ